MIYGKICWFPPSKLIAIVINIAVITPSFIIANKAFIAVINITSTAVAVVPSIVCVVAVKIKIQTNGKKAVAAESVKTEIGFHLYLLLFCPFVSNKPGAGREFSYAFPFCVYGYLNRACSCILLWRIFDYHQQGYLSSLYMRVLHQGCGIRPKMDVLKLLLQLIVCLD